MIDEKLNIENLTQKLAYYSKQYLGSGEAPKNNAVLWLTGLSGSGKTTTALKLQEAIRKLSYKVCVLDGDEVRKNYTSDLSFTDEDRIENIRRVAQLSNAIASQNAIVIVALISPFKENRLLARETNQDNVFLEVYCKAQLEQCEKRDPKGLYKKARLGEIAYFTGIDSRYDVPQNPSISLDTVRSSPSINAARLINLMVECNIIKAFS